MTDRITRAGWHQNEKVGRLLSEIDPDMYERLVDQIEDEENNEPD